MQCNLNLHKFNVQYYDMLKIRMYVDTLGCKIMQESLPRRLEAPKRNVSFLAMGLVISTEIFFGTFRSDCIDSVFRRNRLRSHPLLPSVYICAASVFDGVSVLCLIRRGADTDATKLSRLVASRRVGGGVTVNSVNDSFQLCRHHDVGGSRSMTSRAQKVNTWNKKCADIIDTVLVPWAGYYFRCQNKHILFK